MNPLMPEELSAYLDGELPAARAREVEALMAADPRLRSEFDVLAHADRRWRKAGEAAAFQPALRPRRAATGDYRLWAFGVGLAILLQTALKVSGPMMALVAFNALALALVLAMVAHLFGRDRAFDQLS